MAKLHDQSLDMTFDAARVRIDYSAPVDTVWLAFLRLDDGTETYVCKMSPEELERLARAARLARGKRYLGD